MLQPSIKMAESSTFYVLISDEEDRSLLHCQPDKYTDKAEVDR